MADGRSIMEAAIAAARSRTSWNSWLESAERPASDHEEQKIERAAAIALQIVNNNTWILLQGVSVKAQGSYFNNTNVRLEADMDLRVEMTQVQVVYQNDLVPADIAHIASFTGTGRSYVQLNADIRNTMETDLVKLFGRSNVDATGQKAIKVHGLDGSRADCDIVPTFELNVFQKAIYGPIMLRGVAILGRSGVEWTYNFPEQHHENGVAKRKNTSHRFKKIVRMLKRLNYELETLGKIARRIPSFYVECLTYRVEDEYFLIESDDRYDRVIRVLERLFQLLSDAAWCEQATEVNGIKYLFKLNTSWTSTEAMLFVYYALERLRTER